MKKYLLIAGLLSLCLMRGTAYADGITADNAARSEQEVISLDVSVEIETGVLSEERKTDVQASPVPDEAMVEENKLEEGESQREEPNHTADDTEAIEPEFFITQEEIEAQTASDEEFDAQVMELFSANSDGVLSRELPSMLTERAKFQTVTIEDKIYVIGGVNSSGVITSIDEFDYHAGTWKTVTDLPYKLRGFAATADGNKIYISGGYAGGEFSSKTYTYDIAENIWAEVASMNEPRERHSMVYADGLIYAIGGRNTAGVLDSVECYNFSTNSWTIISKKMANSRMDFAAVAKGHKIYVMGGFCDESGYITDCEVYNVQNSIWEEIPALNMSNAVFAQPTAVAYGDDIHVFWYQTSGTPYIWHSIYHSAYQKWDSQNENIQISLRYICPAALDDGICLIGGYTDYYVGNINYREYMSDVTFLECDYVESQDVLLNIGLIKPKMEYVGGTIYMIGGRRQGSDTPYIYRYDKTNNAWIIATSMPEARRGFTTTAVGNKIYIMGGYYNGRHLSTTIAYDVVNKTWITCAHMPEARENASAVAYGEKIYVVGGRYESDLKENVLVYDTVMNSWTTVKSNILGLDLNLEVIDGTIYIIGGYDVTNAPNSYIGAYTISNGKYDASLSKAPENMKYCRTEIRGNHILIAYQTAYDGSTDIRFKEYIVSENRIVDSDIDFEIPNVWYELCQYDNEIWIVGGYDGTSYSTDVRKLYANGVENTDNLMTLTGTVGKLYRIHFYASGISSFEGKTFVVKYDPSKMSVEDLCAFTPAADVVTAGGIAQTDITVKSFNPNEGLIKFTVNKETPKGQTYWYGDVTAMKFKMLKSSGGNIRFYLE